MLIDRTRADRAAAGQAHLRATETREERTEHEDARAHLLHELVRSFGSDVASRGDRHLRRVHLDAASEKTEKRGGRVDVAQFGNVAEKARAVGRKALDIYFNLANYRNSWKRLGFSEDEINRPGSDRLVDALVAYGTPEQVAARLKEHLDAGADHVPVQILTKDENLVSALAELAGPLGLKPA